MSHARLYTIGHSTRSETEFIDRLTENGIHLLVDVRRFPSSRRHPHFNGATLAATLEAHGIDYRHEEVLGGRRPAQPNSPNTGWRVEGFRAYADHMATDAFQKALARLEADGARRPTAIMCAEAVPWRCHRQLIADALVARGHAVRHILGPGQSQEHTLTSFAKIDAAGHITYPAAEEQLEF